MSIRTYIYTIYRNIAINHKKDKEARLKIENVFLELKTDLHEIAKIEALNSWAMPVIAYTFGIAKSTPVLLTKYRAHHPNFSTARLYNLKCGG